MANFPTKSTGSQGLTTDDKQLLQWVPSNSPLNSTSTTTTQDDERTVLLYNADYGYDQSPYHQTVVLANDAEVVRRGYYFDGTDDYLQIADSSDFDPGTGAFTAECWIKTSNVNRQRILTIIQMQIIKAGIWIWIIHLGSLQEMAPLILTMWRVVQM